MEYLGNEEILKKYKIGFLCSRKVPANIILKTYDWAVEQRNKSVCVVSGFHSRIERDVFDILLKGKQPMILVLARGMKKRIDKILMRHCSNGRLLIISPFDESVKRINRVTALKRNEYIVKICDEIYIPYASESGIIKELMGKTSE